MEEFDYIVVGGGSAGAVLANRLSANPHSRVLLIEDGPDDATNRYIRIPKGFGKLMGDPRYVASFEVEHPGAGNQPERWLRGRTLGGSSAVNGMLWLRGQPEDYDRLAALGNPGWSWADIEPYFRTLEGDVGQAGEVAISSMRGRERLAEAFIAAGESCGLARPERLNATREPRVGYFEANIDRKGRRVSAAHAFLKPVRGRRNLKVVTDTRADRLILENGRAVGVEATREGAPISFRARGEVILSAGAIGSPVILQASGIGPSAHLRRAGVTPLVDLPGVGQNMREHRLLALQYELHHAADSQNKAYSGPGLIASALRYLLTGRGPLAEAACIAGAFVRSVPGQDQPDGQILYSPYSIGALNGLFRDTPGMRIFGYTLRPDSQGSVLITAPGAPPRITPNYMATDYDRTHSIALIRFMRTLMAQPSLKGLVVGEREETSWAQTDAEILDAFNRLGNPGFHACGTCAMGPGEDAVVDARLRVRGVDGLRVADLSIFPEMLSGNTNAPVMAMAMRAADLIIADAASA